MNWKATTALLTIGVFACGDDTEKKGDATSVTTTATDATSADTSQPDDTSQPPDDTTVASDTSVASDTADTAVESELPTAPTEVVEDVEPEVVLTPPDLTCVAEPIQTIIGAGARTTVAVTSFADGSAMEGVTVAMCAAGDPTCDVPLASLVTDQTGELVLNYNPPLGATSPYIQVSGEGIITTRFLPNPGITRGGTRKFDVFVVKKADVAALGEIFGESTPGTAQVLVRALDCAGVPAPLVTVSVDTTTESTHVVYLEPGAPNGRDDTSASGLAGIIDVPVDDVVTVAAAYLTNPYGSFSFRPAADIIFQLDIVPGPVTGTSVGGFSSLDVWDYGAFVLSFDDTRLVRFENAPSCVLDMRASSLPYVDVGDISISGPGIDPATTLIVDQCEPVYFNLDPYALDFDSTVTVTTTGGTLPAMTATVPTSPADVVEVLSPIPDPDSGAFIFTAGDPIDVVWTPPANPTPGQRVSFRMSASAEFWQPTGDLFCSFPIEDGSGVVPGNVTAEWALRVGSAAGGGGGIEVGGFEAVQAGDSVYAVGVRRGDSTAYPFGGLELHSDLVPLPEPPPPPALPEKGPTPPGSVVGTVTLPGTLGGVMSDTVVRGDGSIVAVGRFAGDVDLGLVKLTGSDDIDGVLLMTSSVGVVIGVTRIASTGFTSADHIAVAPDGSIYVVGVFGGDLATLPTPVTSAGASDFYVAKYDNLGVRQWVHTGGGTANEAAFGVVASNDGVYVVGHTYGSATFDGKTISTTSSGALSFVGRYDADGTLAWLTPIGGDGADVDVFDIALVGNRLVGLGNYRGTFELGSMTLDAPCSVDAFWFDMSALGQVTAATPFANPGFDYPRNIATTNDGFVFSTRNPNAGSIGSTPTPPQVDGAALFVSVSTLNAVTLDIADGSGEDEPTALATDSNGGFVATGEYGLYDAPGYLTLGAGEANETVLTTDNRDLFVARYDASGLVWARAIKGPTNGEEANGVALGGDGTVVVTGSFSEGITFDAEHSLTPAFDGMPLGYLVIYR